MMRATAKRSHAKTAQAIALGLATCTFSTSVRADLFCPEAGAFTENADKWLLANSCKLAEGLAVGGPSKLTELAKELFASAANSILPGLGSLLLGLGGGGPDPLSVATQRIIDEIRGAKDELNNSVVTRIDQAVQILLARDNSKQLATFSTLLERVDMWQRFDPATKLVQTTYILALNDDFKLLRNTFAEYVKFSAESVAAPPYQSLELLHYYILLADLEFQIGAQAQYWADLFSQYDKDHNQSMEQVLAAYEQSGLSAKSQAATRVLWRGLFDKANELAEFMGAQDALLKNTLWKYPILDRDAPDDVTKTRTPALDKSEPASVRNPPDNQPTWGDANLVSFRWYGYDYRVFVGRGAGDRFCSTRLFTLDEMASWASVDQSAPDATRYEFGGFFSTTDPLSGLFEHGPRPFCAPTPSARAPLPPEVLPGFDPLPDAYWWDPNILDALRQVQLDRALHSAEYGNIVATGYGPLRAALDKWWRNVRSVEPSTPAARPYNAMDADFDQLLWDNNGHVLRAIGASPDISVGAIVDQFFSGTDQPNPSIELRSKFVGYALQYGVLALLEMSNLAQSLDGEHASDPGTGRRVYPLFLHEAYIDRFAGKGMTTTEYYTTQADIEWQAITDFFAGFGQP